MSSEEAPAWRYLVPGLLFAGLAAYLLITGEIAIDKQRSMTITRAADPGIYWITVLASSTVGILALRKAWQRLCA